jgi:hypothetical protein
MLRERKRLNTNMSIILHSRDAPYLLNPDSHEGSFCRELQVPFAIDSVLLNMGRYSSVKNHARFLESSGLSK